MVAGRPRGEIVAPDAVHRLASGQPIECVWENELGGLSFEVGRGLDRHFVKWVPAGSGLDLGAESERLRWARGFTRVAEVIDLGADSEGSWLVLNALEGETAVSDRWRSDPATAVAAIGNGLRAMHDSLPVDLCPFSWSVEDRLQVIHRMVAVGAADPRRWHEDFGQLTLAEALERLADAPPVDRLVVCHGDACAPNTLIDASGRCSGHVDLGALGVADRWADLAIATWSTGWNYGPGWEHHLLEAYGVEADEERTAYYRLLWTIGP